MPRSCQLPIERNTEHGRVYIPEVRKRNNNNLPEAVIIIENRKYLQISDYYPNNSIPKFATNTLSTHLPLYEDKSARPQAYQSERTAH